jgi:ubiquinone biosynthesis protein
MWTRIETRLPLPILFVGRTSRIVVLTLFFLVAFFLRRLGGSTAGPRLLRWYFQSTGAAFVKLGQVLAMRYDLLPAAYCQELSKLLDRFPPAPTALIIPVIEGDLGRPLSECFIEFEEVPLGSASIAQVHGAKLPNGDLVVVKVIRPGIRRRFQIDLINLKLGGRLVDALGLFAKIEVQRLVGELAQLMQEELDFRREAGNIRLMHEQMQKDDIDHYAPKVYPSLCGLSVITMEKIEGVSIKDILTAMQDRNDALLQTWAAAGISTRRTARILLRSILEQSMRHRLFHADPHAANLIVMQGGTLAWVDFGMLGWLDERLWAHQFRLRQAISEGKIHAAYQSLLATLEPLPRIDLTPFESEVKEYLRDWVLASESSMATVSEKSSGYLFLRIFDAVRRAGLSLPSGLMRLYRTIIVGDIVMLQLDPQIDWLRVIKEFIDDEEQRQATLIINEAFTMSNLNVALQAYMNAPNALMQLLDWTQNQLPQLGPTIRRELNRGERITLVLLRYFRTFAVLAVLTISGSQLVAPALFPGSEWMRFGEGIQPYWGMLTVAGIFMVLFLGRLIHEFRRSD